MLKNTTKKVLNSKLRDVVNSIISDFDNPKNKTMDKEKRKLVLDLMEQGANPKAIDIEGESTLNIIARKKNFIDESRQNDQQIEDYEEGISHKKPPGKSPLYYCPFEKMNEIIKVYKILSSESFSNEALQNQLAKMQEQIDSISARLSELKLMNNNQKPRSIFR